MVDPRLELHHVVDPGQVDKCPFHLRQESRLGVPGSGPRLEHLLEARKPCGLVEPLSVERPVLPRMHLELAGGRGLFHGDACVPEPPEMVFASLGVDEMERLVPPVEAVLDEGLKDAVMLVHAVEERADVAILAGDSVRVDPQRAVVGFQNPPPPPTSPGFSSSTSSLIATLPFEHVRSTRD